MNNIVIFTHAISRGGAEKQGIMLAKVLKDKYNCIIVTWYGEINEVRQTKYVRENNINVIPLKGGFLKKTIAFYRILRKNNIELVFSYLTINNILTAFIGKLAGIKYLIGGLRNSEMSKTKTQINKILHNYFFQRTIVNSYKGYDYFSSKGYKSDKLTVIQNCIDGIQPFINRAELSENVFNILTVGRFQPQKDLYTAIDGFLIAFNTIPEANIHFNIVGIGYLESELRKYIAGKGMAEYITLIVNPDDLNSFFKKSNVYLSTSLYEGLSNSIMEAMAFSLPIIATDVGDNKYLVEHGRNGFLIDTKDTKAIASHICLLYENPSLRQQFGEMSHEKISDFSTDMFRKKYIDFINHIEPEN